MEHNVEIIEVDKTSHKGIYIPKFARIIILNKTTNQIFFPIADVNDLMCMSFDGVAIMNHNGNPYGPIEWFKENYPGAGYDRIEANFEKLR